MSIVVQCSNCGKQMSARDELAGKRAKCACGAIIEIPAASAETSAQDAPQQQAAPQQDAPQQPQPQQSAPQKPKAAAGRQGGQKKAAAGAASHKFTKPATRIPKVQHVRASERLGRQSAGSNAAMKYIAIAGAALAVVLLIASIFMGGGKKETTPADGKNVAEKTQKPAATEEQADKNQDQPAVDDQAAKDDTAKDANAGDEQPAPEKKEEPKEPEKDPAVPDGPPALDGNNGYDPFDL